MKLRSPDEVLKYLINEYILREKTMSKPGLKNVVVTDIDDTIFNRVYCPQREVDVMQGTIMFLKWCNRHGIPVFIVTARPSTSTNREKTLACVNRFNFHYVKAYFYDRRFSTALEYKQWARRDIERRYRVNIIISIGDKNWDFDLYNGILIIPKFNSRCARLFNVPRLNRHQLTKVFQTYNAY